MLLLEQHITRKEQVNELLKLELELDTRENKKYNVQLINNSTVYTKFARGELQELCYIVFWKDHSSNRDIWKLVKALVHLWKMINVFYQDHLKKLIVTSLLLDFALFMAKQMVKPSTKQHYNRDKPAKFTKPVKKT